MYLQYMVIVYLTDSGKVIFKIFKPSIYQRLVSRKIGTFHEKEELSSLLDELLRR